MQVPVGSTVPETVHITEIVEVVDAALIVAAHRVASPARQ